VALQAGFPIEVSGMQLDRRCGSGVQAVATAAMMVQTGVADVVMAGGVESMSNVEYYSTDMRWGARAGSVKLHDRLERGRERSQPEARFGRISGMIETAENLARDYAIPREEADAFARAQPPARRRGLGRRPLRRRGGAGHGAAEARARRCASARRRHARRHHMEQLARLKPIMKDGVVTAGNASQQNDAAAACLVVAEDKLAELG
jgi:acetyl-CoA C-acetyltransferase